MTTLGGPQETATCEELPANVTTSLQAEIEIAVNPERGRK